MEKDVVIEADDISKRYRLGVIDSGSFFKKIANKATEEEYWALRNVSFNVKRGEVLGIIGKNGAGKSTLLKILSQITKPTTGTIRIKGKVASLLEVGTGFHPELSGRDNIFLNGTILGMKKVEIKNKFDEIVAFSGVEKYIDTPVKRYSSGMYVRLAFAVAAHLEPEILIVDEVLAVGDAEFQKKCLGKMKDVAGQGRTVLFVSHNMQAISTLTTKCIVLSNGKMTFEGNTTEAISFYLSQGGTKNPSYEMAALSEKPSVTRVQIITSLPNNTQVNGEPMEIHFEVNTPYPLQGAAVAFQAINNLDSPVLHLWNFDSDNAFCREKGIYKLVCKIPKMRLYMGSYKLVVHFAESSTGKKLETIENICPFEVVMYGKKREYDWVSGTCNYIEECNWEVSRLKENRENTMSI